MRILITGICGFVGLRLAHFLQDALSAEICGLDNFIRPGSAAQARALQARGIRFFHGDLRLASDLESLPKVDWIIDAAAQPSVLAGVDGRTSSRQLVEHNLLGTVNLLEYARRCGAGFVLLSTSRVYAIEPLAHLPVVVHKGAFTLPANADLPPGVSARGIDETFSTRAPVSLYGATKIASETLALEYSHSFSLPVWINRCGVLAGAGQFGRPDQGIFSFWLHSWKAGAPLRYLGFGGQGHQVRDCLHPDDLGRLLTQQLQTTPSPERPALLNVAGGPSSARSLRQLSQWCEIRWGSHPVTAHPTERPFDLPWVVLDSSLAQSVWSWQPQLTTETILQEIARHAEEHPEWLTLSAPWT